MLVFWAFALGAVILHVVVLWVGARRAVGGVFEGVLLHLQLQIQVVLILILGVGKLCVDLDCRHGPSRLAGLPRSLRLLLPFEWQRSSPLLLNLPRFHQPLRKYSLAIILHVVTGEEDGSHGIQQVLVVVQVLFVLDELELELLLDVLVLQ